MFSTALLQPLFSALWYLAPLLILVFILKSPYFKGAAGEFLVNSIARLRLDKHRYRLIKNVTLPTADGTTQIDHIIVSPYGVFVVETKNMKGWIYGSIQQRQWTQKLFRQSYKFQNPLHQNYKHVKTLQSLLDLSNGEIQSLVVFVGESTFKTSMPDNVTDGGGYIRYIKSFSQPVLSATQVESIIERIESGRLTRSLKTHHEHIQHVKSQQQEAHDNERCPKCGSPMVLRESKKDQNSGNKFWGCQRFPKCRGLIKQVDDSL